jgi:hypothetical protein
MKEIPLPFNPEPGEPILILVLAVR